MIISDYPQDTLFVGDVVFAQQKMWEDYLILFASGGSKANVLH